MILDFEFSNFKSFKETQYFSMRQRSSIDTETDVIENENPDDNVVRVAAIYGANAAGKTGVLEAIVTLCNIVSRSEQDRQRQAIEDRFADGNDEPVRFCITFIMGEEQKKFRYEIQYKESYIEFEQLLKYVSSRPTVVYERQYDFAKQRGVLQKIDKKLSKGLSKEQKDAIPYFLQTQLDVTLLNFLGRAKDSTNEEVSRVLRHLTHRIYFSEVSQAEMISQGLSELIRKNEEAQDWLSSLLPVADFGIESVDTVEERGNGLSPAQEKIFMQAVRDMIRVDKPDITNEELEREVAQKSGKTFRLLFGHMINGKRADFGSEQESRGTIAAAHLFVQLCPILEMGATLLVDELDCSLHPMLVKQIVDVFNNSDTNPHGAQLIFTTHDISLLDKTIYGEDVLGRDEVWFVEKDQFGMSKLYPLSSIKRTTRKEDNLYRKYVEGRYGAIPNLSIASCVEAYWAEHSDA